MVGAGRHGLGRWPCASLGSPACLRIGADVGPELDEAPPASHRSTAARFGWARNRPPRRRSHQRPARHTVWRTHVRVRARHRRL